MVGYTFQETLAYSIIAACSCFLVYKLLRKMRIRINEEFFLSLFPFVLSASFARVTRDLYLFDYAFLSSPYIYVVWSSIYLSLLVVSRKLLGKNWSFATFSLGIVTLGFFLGAYLSVARLEAFACASMGSVAITLALLFFTLRYLLPSDAFGRLTIASQGYDGFVTFVAMEVFGYGEQHWLPNLLFSWFGCTLIFPVLKLIIASLIVFTLNKSSLGEEANSFIKILVSILGIGTGTRDLLCVISSCVPH